MGFFKDKTTIITGAGSGIGHALGKSLADAATPLESPTSHWR